MKWKFIFVILLNFFIYIFLFPYIQATANQHMSTGDFFNIIFYSIAVIIFLYSLLDYFLKRKIFNLLFFTLIFITLIFWGTEFGDVFCEVCKNSD